MERWRQVNRQIRTLPGDDIPVVLSRDGTHGPVVHAVSVAAQARGIVCGARIVDVQAIHPDLHVERADPRGDEAFVERLVHWSRRWCPWTVKDHDGITMDATGCAHLFGGETAMLRDINQRFAMQGMTVRIAMAPTRGAAQALARYGATVICDETTVAEALNPLPVAALRIAADTVRLLDRLGLKTIGALADIPRSALMRRFSTMKPDANPLILLDRMMGKLADPLNAPADPVWYMSRVRLAEPVIDPVPHLKALAEQLCTDLAKAEQGARHLRLTIYRVDSECRTVQLSTARATRDPLHMVRLFDGKLDSIDPGFGFDLLTLEASRVEPVSLLQENLDGKRDSSADVAALLDRLTARLGPEKVTWSTWVQSHKPERFEARVPALRTQPENPPVLTRDRPLRLLQTPEAIHVLYAVPEGPPSQFRWRNVAYRMARYEGPERIAPEWWMDKPGTRLRDYYKVEVTDGRRFWLYRQGVTYDGRGGAPDWFLHGFFA